MLSRWLLCGPSLSALESRAFDELVGSVGTHPESILYLSQKDHPLDATRDRWQEYGPSATLRIDSFDGIVSDFFERDQYKGPVTNIDQPLLDRLVELGVEHIESASNPLYAGSDFPSSDLIEEARTIYTELEFAGLLTPAEMRQRLEEEGATSRSVEIEELAEAIDRVRTEILADELRETYRSERLHHVTTSSTSLDDVFPSVEAVIIAGFSRFNPLERDLVERIANTWPTTALLPQLVDGETVTGVDTGASRALEIYEDLDFTYEYHAKSNPVATDGRRTVARNLYRHPAESPSVDDVDATALGVTVLEAETLPDEIRAVARDVRARLAGEPEPDDIGVVLTNPSTYADHVREVFETYEIPFALRTEIALPDTAIGAIIQSVCQLTREPRTIDQLLGLLTNPLVDVRHGDEPLDHRTLTRVAARVETNRLDGTLEHVDGETTATIESLVRDARAMAETELDALPGQLEALLERLGVPQALAGDRDINPTLQAREQRAHDSLERVLETLELTAPLAELELGDAVDRLERAIQGVSIQRNDQRREDSVTVCSLAESVAHDFEHVYVLGMTASHFPADPERTSFARPIYESHPDFEQTDLSAEARYHFGALLGSEARISLSIPQSGTSGEPFVEADAVTELGRLIDVDEITVDPTPTPGCQEDVQRSIGQVLPDLSEDRKTRLLEEAVDSGSFTDAQNARITAGVACATARASSDLTEYDGQLTQATVSTIHDATRREPYSASRLETYAACGFKYYMRRVLGIEAPDDLPLEPDAGARGTYIHDVLEHYYQSFQTTNGEPIDPGGDLLQRRQRLLDVALDRLDETFDDTSVTAFQEEWLMRVLAGLGTPETNPYYGPERTTEEGQPLARGLLYRFLEHEADEVDKATARPAWFEARVGEPYDAGTSIQVDPAIVSTPSGSVPVYGLVDRIDAVPGTNPTQVVVRDYKTGNSTPSETDALLGLKFQLPLYALMAEDALDDVETVGGAYYQISPPSSVNSRSGLVTSQEMATYHDTDDVETPLLRHSYPHFQTHEAFRRFVEITATERLGQLTTGIAKGHYHPTVLDPSDAGCRYCDYAHVCDVRPHRRQEAIQAIDDEEVPAYVPPKARGLEPEDVVEVD